MRKSGFSHVGPRGAKMVAVSRKAATERTARAEAHVVVGPVIAALLRKTGGVAKGNVVETARIAGIMAAKRTADLVPMCHPLTLDHVEVRVELRGARMRIESAVRCRERTGAEMEALTAAAVAALTIYDMCKSADKGIEIRSVRLLEKSGGKSGVWRR